MVQKILHGSGIEKGPFSHDRQVAARRRNIFYYVGGKQNRTPFRKIHQQIPDPHPLFRVQARGRLIDNQKFRLAKHCLNEPHSPLHSTGELAHLLFLMRQKPRLLQIKVNSLFTNILRNLGEFSQIFQTFSHRKSRIKIQLLRKIAQFPFDRFILLWFVPDVIQPDFSLLWRKHCCQHSHQCRLPRPVFP